MLTITLKQYFLLHVAAMFIKFPPLPSPPLPSPPLPSPPLPSPPLRYLLWFRLACPQPPQPLLTNQLLCVEGSRTAIPDTVTSNNQLTFTFTGSDSSDPLPYTAYQFQVEAQNSVGSATSPYSDAVETFTAGIYYTLVTRTHTHTTHIFT